MLDKGNIMDLKANYERLFGKIKQVEDKENFVMNEVQRKRFSNLSNILGKKYPNAALTIKEGYVFVGYKKFEDVEKFLSRTSLNIQETVRSISTSGKKGLL